MKLKQYRVDKGLTQSYVAKVLGISQQAYCNKEVGKRNFTIKEILILEKIMNVKISDIYDKLNEEIENELSLIK